MGASLTKQSSVVADSSGTECSLRDKIARIVVPYWLGGFENQERDADTRKWKHPPYTPNKRAYQLADAILAADALEPVQVVLKLGWFKIRLNCIAQIKLSEPKP